MQVEPIAEEVKEAETAELAVKEPKIAGRDWRQVFVDAELSIDLAADPAELATIDELSAELAADADMALVETVIGSASEVGPFSQPPSVGFS